MSCAQLDTPTGSKSSLFLLLPGVMHNKKGECSTAPVNKRKPKNEITLNCKHFKKETAPDEEKSFLFFPAPESSINLYKKKKGNSISEIFTAAGNLHDGQHTRTSWAKPKENQRKKKKKTWFIIAGWISRPWGRDSEFTHSIGTIYKE